MADTSFVLNEKFCSAEDDRRKERFQKELERYIVDALSTAALPEEDA